MKRKNTALLVFCLLVANIIFAQNTANVEMADALIENGKIYIVVGVLSIVFVCIVAYLIILDRKISKLEKQN